MRVVITALAKQDIREVLDWYGKQSSKAPLAFVNELEDIVYGIRQHPKRWPPLDKEDRRRFAIFRNFPYELINLPTQNQITILAVRHQKRRPLEELE